MSENREMGFATKALHTYLPKADWDCSRAVVPPITMTSNFIMSSTAEVEGEYMYGRYGNPSRHAVEAILASLENAKYALAFSSGMAAANAVMETLHQGDHIIASKQLYGAIYNLIRHGLPKVGIESTFVSVEDPEIMKSALTPQTKLVWLEVCSNPLLRITDLEKVARIIKDFNKDIIIAVDNTFLTPFIVKPLDFGIDIVMHSCTKYLGGHCDILMGSLATNDDVIFNKLKSVQRYRGATPSPFDCFLLTRSLKTLKVRMREHISSGLEVARYLEKHPAVTKVLHPTLPSHPDHDLAMKQHKGLHSGVVSFYIKGGKEEAIAFLLATKLFIRAASLGGDHSLALHPTTTTHAQVTKEDKADSGIVDDLVRISVGLEDVEDLIWDLEVALEKATGLTSLKKEEE